MKSPHPAAGRMTITPRQESLLRRARCFAHCYCSQEETLYASRLVAAGWLTWNPRLPRTIEITEAGRVALRAIGG
jgi:hypothetical protein